MARRSRPYLLLPECRNCHCPKWHQWLTKECHNANAVTVLTTLVITIPAITILIITIPAKVTLPNKYIEIFGRSKYIIFFLLNLLNNSSNLIVIYYYYYYIIIVLEDNNKILSRYIITRSFFF